MKIIVITGMSGAGKSAAARALEDMGYFCIDNLPSDLLPGLIQAYNASSTGQAEAKKLALVMDVRGMKLFGDIADKLVQLRQQVPDTTIFFLEATDQALIGRYKLSRRSHPLSQDKGISLSAAISEERLRLAPLRGLADMIIETSEMQGRELSSFLENLLADRDADKPMTIFLQSFGFKYSLPADCDNVWDVRFIPNPYYVDSLRPLCGLDQAIVDYLNKFPVKQEFLDYLFNFYKFSLPLYFAEGKRRLTIGIGCSGGRHRSVAITEELKEQLQGQGYQVLVLHRDLDK